MQTRLIESLGKEFVSICWKEARKQLYEAQQAAQGVSITYKYMYIYVYVSGVHAFALGGWMGVAVGGLGRH